MFRINLSVSSILWMLALIFCIWLCWSRYTAHNLEKIQEKHRLKGEENKAEAKRQKEAYKRKMALLQRQEKLETKRLAAEKAKQKRLDAEAKRATKPKPAKKQTKTKWKDLDILANKLEQEDAAKRTKKKEAIAAKKRADIKREIEKQKGLYLQARKELEKAEEQQEELIKEMTAFKNRLTGAKNRLADQEKNLSDNRSVHGRSYRLGIGNNASRGPTRSSPSPGTALSWDLSSYILKARRNKKLSIKEINWCRSGWLEAEFKLKKLQRKMKRIQLEKDKAETALRNLNAFDGIVAKKLVVARVKTIKTFTMKDGRVITSTQTMETGIKFVLKTKKGIIIVPKTDVASVKEQQTEPVDKPKPTPEPIPEPIPAEPIPESTNDKLDAEWAAKIKAEQGKYETAKKSFLRAKSARDEATKRFIAFRNRLTGAANRLEHNMLHRERLRKQLGRIPAKRRKTSEINNFIKKAERNCDLAKKEIKWCRTGMIAAERKIAFITTLMKRGEKQMQELSIILKNVIRQAFNDKGPE